MTIDECWMLNVECLMGATSDRMSECDHGSNAKWLRMRIFGPANYESRCDYTLSIGRPNRTKANRTGPTWCTERWRQIGQLTSWGVFLWFFVFLHCLTENIYRPKARQLRIFVFGLAFKPKLPGWARDYCVFFVCVCLVVVGSLLLIKWLKWQSKSVGRNRAAKPKPGQESLCQCRALSPPLGISESPNLRHLICCFGLPHKFALETRDPRLEVYSRRFCKRVRVCQVSIALSSSTWVRKLEIRKMKTYNNRQQGLSE